MNLRERVRDVRHRIAEIVGPGYTPMADYEIDAVLTAAFDELRQAAERRERKRCANVAIDWTDDKERDDYDTFSAASAISAAIRTTAEP